MNEEFHYDSDDDNSTDLDDDEYPPFETLEALGGDLTAYASQAMSDPRVLDKEMRCGQLPHFRRLAPACRFGELLVGRTVAPIRAAHTRSSISCAADKKRRQRLSRYREPSTGDWLVP